MKTVIAALVAAAVAALGGACNNVGACPAGTQVVPGGSCSGDNLQCPYTLGPVDAAVATSCVCADGRWSCPRERGGSEDAGRD